MSFPLSLCSFVCPNSLFLLFASYMVSSLFTVRRNGPRSVRRLSQKISDFVICFVTVIGFLALLSWFALVHGLFVRQRPHVEYCSLFAVFRLELCLSCLFSFVLQAVAFRLAQWWAANLLRHFLFKRVHRNVIRVWVFFICSIISWWFVLWSYVSRSFAFEPVILLVVLSSCFLWTERCVCSFLAFRIGLSCVFHSSGSLQSGVSLFAFSASLKLG